MAEDRGDRSEMTSLGLPVDIVSTIEKIAEASDKSRDWIIARALRKYIAGEGAEILQIAGGLAQIERGEYVDMDDLIAELEEANRRHLAA